MRHRSVIVVLVLFMVAIAAPRLAQAQGRSSAPAGPPPSIADKTAGMEKMDGFFPMYWDGAAGQLWLEIPTMGEEVLYIAGLSAGIGSNDIGLDRGQSRGGRLIRFERVGPKVMMVQPNTDFRASSDNPDEKRAVEEAFAKSILWGFTVAAESDGRVLVDLTDFLMRDEHGVAARLRPAQFRVDTSRSAVFMERTKNFPDNTEMDVTLTFTGEVAGGGGFGGGGNQRGPGGGFGRGALSAVTPTPSAVTVRQHHSLVRLPGPGYEPRAHDPRSGVFDFSYEDYSVPLGTSLTQRALSRHRLQKKDPRAAVSEAVEPIVYYLDRGTPEPVRSALLDGARWWNQAFEAAGYKDAFQVELMPEGADLMDVRYNVIQWVHRSTRGWSYGGGVSDPRTGELIKGQVTLGSLRVRQDYLIAEGLLSPYVNGTETPPELAEWALARLRQLSAHEVGHTLGFGHNYFASSMGRTSVMDYPHPLVTLQDGKLDFADVYDDKIGEWDKVFVAYAYQDFPPGADDSEELRSIIDEAWKRNLIYMTNQDMSANPRVHQWANGDDPVLELNRMMEVRRFALDRFGEHAIKLNQPLATLEEVLVPLYLHHRYQVSATASALGGQDYRYSLRGDGHGPSNPPVSAGEQLGALDALLATVTPGELAIPRSVLAMLPPRPSGYGRHRELFPRYTGMTFDVITPAVVAAQHVASEIFAPDRAARLVQQNALDPTLPGLHDVIDRTLAAVFMHDVADGYEAEIARAVQSAVTEQLMALAAGADMPQVRAIATSRLSAMATHMRASAQGENATAMDASPGAAFTTMLAMDIARFLRRPAAPYEMPTAPEAPPGAPIGQPGQDWLGIDELPPLQSMLDLLVPAEPACSREH